MESGDWSPLVVSSLDSTNRDGESGEVARVEIAARFVRVADPTRGIADFFLEGPVFGLTLGLLFGCLELDDWGSEVVGSEVEGFSV